MRTPRSFTARQIVTGAVFCAAVAGVLGAGVTVLGGQESTSSPVTVPGTTPQSSVPTETSEPGTTPSSTAPATTTTVQRPGPSQGTTPPDTAAPRPPSSTVPPQTGLPSSPPFAISGAEFYDTFKGGDYVQFFFYYETPVTELCEKIQSGMRSTGWEITSANCSAPDVNGLRNNLGMWVSHNARDQIITVKVYK